MTSKTNLLAATFSLLLLPILATAQTPPPPKPEVPAGVEITSQADLVKAGASGGMYFIKKDITLTSPVNITGKTFNLSATDVMVENPDTGEKEVDPKKRYTLSGGGTTSILNITAAGTSLLNIGLTKGKAAAVTETGRTVAQGGAIKYEVGLPAAGTAAQITAFDKLIVSDNTAAITGQGDVYAQGGAFYINNEQKVMIANSVFKNNSVTAQSSDGGIAEGSGGALYVIGQGEVAIAATTFEGNTAQDSGGAILNAGKMGLDNVTFKKNKANLGGAIIDFSLLDIKNSVFEENEALQTGGAIYVFSGGDVKIAGTTFKKNTATDSGGAIFNEGTNLVLHSSLFSENTAATAGAILNMTDLTIGAGVTFNGNEALSGHGGAIVNNGTMSIGPSLFKGNKAFLNGGAIYSSSSTSGKGNLHLTGGVFEGNSAQSLGGAIYADSIDVNIDAKTDVTFTGNTDSTGSNAIFLKDSKLNLNAGTGSINFADKISGTSTSVININGTNANDSSIAVGAQTNGFVNFSSTQDSFGGTINVYGGGVGFTGDVTFATSAFNMGNAAINMINNSINTVTIANFNATGDNKIQIDVDPLNSKADVFNTTNGATGTLKITNAKIISEALGDITGPITISNSLKIEVDENQKYYGALFRYRLLQSGDHDILVNRTNEMTPSVLSSSITQNVLYANNMLISRSLMDRVGVMLSRDGRYYNARNSYSLSEHDKFLNKEPAQTQDITQKDWYTTWFVPYGAKQTLNLKNGQYSTNSDTYGATAGVDMPVINLGDYGLIPTVFAGYGGSSQSYDVLKLSEDSFLIGTMATFYRENFFGSFEMHISNGSVVSDMDSSSRDKFDVFSFTTAARAEYAFNFADIMQLRPSLMAAYNLANAQDYKTDLGANIHNSLMHNIQITPGIKLMANINGWHPYANVNYAFNVLNSSKVSANNLIMPKFAVKNYIEYGIGVENTFLEKYSGYVQVSGYGSGITGIGVQVGLRAFIE